MAAQDLPGVGVGALAVGVGRVAELALGDDRVAGRFQTEVHPADTGEQRQHAHVSAVVTGEDLAVLPGHQWQTRQKPSNEVPAATFAGVASGSGVDVGGEGVLPACEGGGHSSLICGCVSRW